MDYSGLIEFETSTGLHEGMMSYDSIEELEEVIRTLMRNGYVINFI